MRGDPAARSPRRRGRRGRALARAVGLLAAVAAALLGLTGGAGATAPSIRAEAVLSPSIRLPAPKPSAVRAASLTTLNPVLAPFRLSLVYRPVDTASIELDRLELSPYASRLGSPVGGCLRCAGHGRLTAPSISGRTLTVRVHGIELLGAATRVGEAIMPSGEIGRFEIDGVTAAPARPVVRRRGCLGADTRVTVAELLGGRPLPVVACRAPSPRDGDTHFSAPSELSAVTHGSGTVTGRTHGGRWLTVIVLHRPCRATAQATSRLRGATTMQWHVRGSFRRRFTTPVARTPGSFCVYLQTGGRWGRVPDGRISQRGSIPFFAGDRVAISSSPMTQVAAGQSITSTFSGFASAAETLWTFDSYVPCAASAQAQYDSSTGFGEDAVRASFSLTIKSVPLSQTAYRCAYLQYGKPAGEPGHGVPTGPTLAAASELVAVS